MLNAANIGSNGGAKFQVIVIFGMLYEFILDNLGQQTRKQFSPICGFRVQKGVINLGSTALNRGFSDLEIFMTIG